MHNKFLLKALDEAYKGKGTSFPNPAVGALLVKGGEILSRGFHHKAGTDHAEVVALRSCTVAPEDAVLYVTLEPCCHHGRTPPCTDLIIHKGVRQVVFGYRDPNPQVCGSGLKQLAEAGVSVRHVALPQIDSFYQSYKFWTHTGRPYCTAKIAATVDGVISGPAGEPRQLSSVDSAQLTHYERGNHCAFLTTAATICADDPLFTVRIDSIPQTRRLYILDSKLSSPLSARIWSTGAELVFFHRQGLDSHLLGQFSARGARLIEVPLVEDRLSLADVFFNLEHDGIHDLWIEAGGTLLQSLLTASRLHRLLWYSCPFFGEPHARRALGSGLTSGSYRQPRRCSVRALGSEAIFEMTW